MMRVLCLWFPLWPIQRLRFARPELRYQSLALYDVTPRGERLRVCSPRALRMGLRPEMSRAEAETLAGGDAVSPSLQLVESEPETDRRLLEQLGFVCQELFTPLVALEEVERPESLFLGIDGCAHLFGGERGLLRALAQEFRSRGWRMRCALAETWGAAWALAHAAPRSVTCVAPGGTAEALHSLPLTALRIAREPLVTLTELGVETIGQLMRFPRADLAARLEAGVLQRLRQALGEEPESLAPLRRPEPIEARWASDEGLSDQGALEAICRELLQQVFSVSRSRGVLPRALICRLEGSGGREQSYSVELVQPTDDVTHVVRLLELQWEQRPFPRQVHTLVIHAQRMSLRGGSSGALFDAGRSREHQAALRLVERLTSRLGKEVVLRAELTPETQPELAVSLHSWTDDSSSRKAATSLFEGPSPVPPRPWERPLRLQPPASLKVWSVVPDGPPQRVEWRDQMQAVVRWWGPERMETAWWHGRQCRRDYYRVELESGEWLWIYRCRPEGDWRLQGLFD